MEKQKKPVKNQMPEQQGKDKVIQLDSEITQQRKLTQP